MHIFDMSNVSDILYILILVMGVVAMGASARVNSVFKQYSRVPSMSRMTGEETARRMLQAAGITDVAICQVAGTLTDHYDPVNKKLCLSEAVYGMSSVAAIGVAAHECGHAIQHQERYLPLTLRSLILPVANIGSRIWIWLIILGTIFSYNQFLINVGIFVFSFAVIFQVITLPVEFDASRRAIRLTESYGILSSAESDDCKKVLRAAAMTYVASTAIAVLQFLRLISIFGKRRK